ncbi:nucleic acid-binding protein [Lojkania enalia]|uniref:Nucleic acid-binding protein n=1 Tax=Lojkania enalia TaxID=147567 RepID=A0A9P4KHV3_9PLEO|nr:nucleic acid-binding protein [Didymosphaeria enalia]
MADKLMKPAVSLKKSLRAPMPLVQNYISSTRIGVVVSAGRMDRAVKVRIAGQEWHKKFRKFFPSPQTHIVSDPNNSLVEGDVVAIQSGNRTSKNIRHVVHAIVAPFGRPVEERPPVLSEKERIALRIQRRLEKDVRAATKGRAVSKERLRIARKQGYEIPSLEQAFRNVKVTDRLEAEKRKSDAAEVHAGQVGEMAMVKQRKKDTGKETKDERIAKEEKYARVQTVA